MEREKRMKTLKVLIIIALIGRVTTDTIQAVRAFNEGKTAVGVLFIVCTVLYAILCGMVFEKVKARCPEKKTEFQTE